MIDDFETLRNENTKINRRYADIVASMRLINYKTKTSYEQSNLTNMQRKGFVTFNQIHKCIKYPTSDNYIFRNNAIKQSLPKIWFTILDSFKTYNTQLKPLEYIYIGLNKFKSIRDIKTKDIREIIKYKNCTEENLNNLLTRAKLINQNINPEKAFKQARTSTISTKYRHLQYRILHCDIYTKEKLCKIGLVVNPLCDRCMSQNKEFIEDFDHLFFGCEISKICWQITSKTISKLTKENIELDKINILFGLDHNQAKQHSAINTILARIKNNFIQITRPTNHNYEKIIIGQITEIMECEKFFMNKIKFEKKME